METPTKPVAGAKPAFTTQSLVMMAIFAAILCISAYISIPIPVPGAPHITLLNFVILLIVSLVSSVAGDWTKVMENKSKIQKLNKKYNELLSEEEKLQSEVTKLQDDDYIPKYIIIIL